MWFVDHVVPMPKPGGRVPRFAHRRVIWFFWPMRAFAGKTVHRTVFWPGSLLEPDFYRSAFREAGADFFQFGCKPAFLNASSASVS